MDETDSALKDSCSKDISSAEKNQVLELAQKHSGILCTATVAGAEAFVKHKHNSNETEGGDISVGGYGNISGSNFDQNEFSAEYNTSIELPMNVMDKVSKGVQNIDISKVAEAAAESTQCLGNLAGLMIPVPKQLQGVTAKAVSLVAFEILTNVFDISVSFTNFNTMAFALKQIQSELDELQRKMDKLLRSDYETATHRLKHAMNYLENTNMHPEGYNEFAEVLKKSNEALPKLDEFEDKLFIKKVSIFARFMTNCYDKKIQQFVPLGSLPIENKQTIANAVMIDLEEVLSEFNNIKIPFYKKMVRQKKKEEEKNQNLLDSLLKVRICVVVTLLIRI
jgi:hypothetical protein